MSVHSMRPELSEEDIVRLMKGETSEERATVAHRLCRRIAIDLLSEDERVYADEIIGILAKDTAELVRRTLAVTLRNSPRLPHDVAVKLAQDVESVAIPVLESSPVFTDEDLIELVLAVTSAKQAAIAGRATLSGSLTEVICEHAAKEAVEVASANPGADFTDKAFEDTVARFPANASIHESIVLRDHVPVHIAEKMVSLVSGDVFDMLINRHELPAQMAIDLAAGARERATVDLVEQAGRTTDMSRFVQQLNLNGRLTHSLIMRALCVGHMSFVEHSLAELSGVPHSRVWLMIHDAGPLGLQAIFDRSGLHRKLLPAFRAAVTVFHELELDGETNDKARFRMRMIERVLTQFQAIPKDDLDYLLEKLDSYSDQAKRATESAA
ncbi:MAG: pole-localized protein SpbR [Henriciella sp.]